MTADAKESMGSTDPQVVPVTARAGLSVQAILAIAILAALTVLLLVLTCLPWIERIPVPVLAAIVIHHPPRTPSA